MSDTPETDQTDEVSDKKYALFGFTNRVVQTLCLNIKSINPIGVMVTGPGDGSLTVNLECEMPSSLKEHFGEGKVAFEIHVPLPSVLPPEEAGKAESFQNQRQAETFESMRQIVFDAAREQTKGYLPDGSLRGEEDDSE